MDTLLTALVTGCLAQRDLPAATAVLAAYRDLKALLRARLGRRPEFEQALAALERHPAAAEQAALASALADCGLVWDAELAVRVSEVLAASDAALATDDEDFGVAVLLEVGEHTSFNVPAPTADEGDVGAVGDVHPKDSPMSADSDAGSKTISKRRTRGRRRHTAGAAPTASEPGAVGATEGGPARTVSMGFAAASDANRPVPDAKPLASDTDHYFWFEVGRARAEGSIVASDAAPLPVEHLPRDAVLQVALFGFADGLQLSRGHDLGGLRLLPDGTWEVTSAPAAPGDITPEVAARRLFFPVRTPARGRCRLRCNIYFRQVLVQSHLIDIHVGRRPRASASALRSTVDYTLSRTLQPQHLAGLDHHRLSLMLNQNGKGSHGFRFLGQDEFKSEATLDGQALQNLIDQARRAQRRAAWGDEAKFTGAATQVYRYSGALDLARLTVDLVRFARRGYRFYDALIGSLAGGEKAVAGLTELMRLPGDVQIALKDVVGHAPPVAMFYDRPFDTSLRDADVVLCPAFVAAVQARRPLRDEPCFQGMCPTHGVVNTVCPGGFWGFRHRLGLPVAGPNTPDAPAAIVFHDRPEIVVGASTDPQFVQRSAHQQRLQTLFATDAWHLGDTRKEVVDLLGQDEFRASLVYFYCHGGLTDDELPYILVGDPDTEPVITRDNLRLEKISWDQARPLVFINGCHTTAVEPEQAINLVSGFVEVALAAGVIGSEITVFEPLATKFAEACLQAFVVDGQTIGESVRRARLAVLEQGNPLGLVYVPFVLSTLKLLKQSA